MKVLFVGHGGCYNHGCEAIVLSSLLMFSKEFSDLKVTLASFDPEGDSKVDFGFPVKVIPGRSHKLWEKGSVDWFYAKVLRRFSEDAELGLINSPIVKDMKQSDVVISVGGDNYTDDYKYASLKMYLDLNKFVKSQKKKLVIWGASVGPFNMKDKLPEIIDGLNLADLITVRESRSFEYLEKLGIKNIRRVADPAFLLKVRETALPEGMRDSKAVKVGFNVSPLLRDYLSSGSEDIFMKESLKFLKKIITEQNVSVVLIPHVIQPGARQTDDHAYMSNIYEALKDTGKVMLIAPKYNAEELKFIISSCNYFIGARTHATIGALSTGTPTISIGYSQKSIGLNEDLFGNLKYVLDMKNFSADELMAKYTLLRNEEGEIKAKIASSLPRIKEMSWANVKFLKELLAK